MITLNRIFCPALLRHLIRRWSLCKEDLRLTQPYTYYKANRVVDQLVQHLIVPLDNYHLYTAITLLDQCCRQAAHERVRNAPSSKIMGFSQRR